MYFNTSSLARGIKTNFSLVRVGSVLVFCWKSLAIHGNVVGMLHRFHNIIQLFYATAAIIYTYILMDFDSQNVQLCVMMLTWLKMESQFLVVNGTLEKIMTTD